MNAGQGFDTKAMFASMFFIVVYLHIFRGQLPARD
jgi:quinol-cytochrome oxidoreductase complex cytochrome b subunit